MGAAGAQSVMLPLSVLDLSFVTTGAPPSAALRNTLELARHVDRLGYARYWLAEHHNLPSVASPAPEIMIGQVAAVTHRIRVGSGGVMLPNHPPLMVAERFNQVTAFALRQRDVGQGRDDFLERLQELIFWEMGFPEGHPFGKVEAMPSDAPLPPIWILGSSDYGARLAASMGVGFAFAHHFASYDASAVMRLYRDGFKAGGVQEKPYAILAVAVVCADTDAPAERLAASLDYTWLRRESGEYRPLPSPEEALAYPYTEADRERIRRNRARLFVGSPATVRERLSALVEATQADELMVTSAIYGHEARKRSYELVMDAFG
jgi:alkanesulfonate monooxygenase SsuD/methylene tetrahydromethanopterin reductase-like flavin-dependent oxidoreductase (luciferase family)